MLTQKIKDFSLARIFLIIFNLKKLIEIRKFYDPFAESHKNLSCISLPHHYRHRHKHEPPFKLFFCLYLIISRHSPPLASVIFYCATLLLCVRVLPADEKTSRFSFSTQCAEISFLREFLENESENFCVCERGRRLMSFTPFYYYSASNIWWKKWGVLRVMWGVFSRIQLVT